MSEDGANTGDKAESRRWGRDRREERKAEKLIKDLYTVVFLPLLPPSTVKLYMLGTAKCEDLFMIVLLPSM